MNQALKGFIAQQELAEKRWLETLPALESARAGRLMPAEQVFAWLRSCNAAEELPKPNQE